MMFKTASEAVPDLASLSSGWSVQQAVMPDGWSLRWAFWQTAQPVRGHVLILSGRPEPLEYYPEIAAMYADMGYKAVFFERRGQGLSGRVLEQEPLKDHITSFDTHLSDLSHFCTKIFAPLAQNGEAILHGHSMGGHLALRHAAREGGFTRVVVSSPLVGLPKTFLPSVVESSIINFMGQKFSTSYGYGQGQDDPASRVFEGNPHCSYRPNWQSRIDLLKARPDLRMGGVTWGWMAAALNSCHALQKEAGLISVPVLLHLSAHDRVVSPQAQEELIVGLRCARIERYDDACHEISQEGPEVKGRFWGSTRTFLRGLNP